MGIGAYENDVWESMCDNGQDIIQDLWELDKIDSADILKAISELRPSMFNDLMLAVWELVESDSDKKCMRDIQKAVDNEYHDRCAMKGEAYDD